MAKIRIEQTLLSGSSLKRHSLFFFFGLILTEDYWFVVPQDTWRVLLILLSLWVLGVYSAYNLSVRDIVATQSLTSRWSGHKRSPFFSPLSFLLDRVSLIVLYTPSETHTHTELYHRIIRERDPIYTHKSWLVSSLLSTEPFFVFLSFFCMSRCCWNEIPELFSDSIMNHHV